MQALRYETPEFLELQLEEGEEEEEGGKTGGEEHKKDLSLETTYSEGEAAPYTTGTHNTFKSTSEVRTLVVMNMVCRCDQ